MLPPLPFRAKLVRYDATDCVGALEAENGVQLRCGGSSFQGRTTPPEVGDWFMVEEYKELPVIGPKATRVVSVSK